MVSELVTNAIRHGSRPADKVGVDFTIHGRRLSIGVRDAARGLTTPAARARDNQRMGGRGLDIVAQLATVSERLLEGRRELRAELPLRRRDSLDRRR